MEITRIQSFNASMERFIDKLLPELEELYKDIHRNPELSMVACGAQGMIDDGIAAWFN